MLTKEATHKTIQTAGLHLWEFLEQNCQPPFGITPCRTGGMFRVTGTASLRVYTFITAHQIILRVCILLHV